MEKYIPLNALVAEIERRIKYYENIQMIKPVYESNIEELNELLSFLDTFEVKEVDLDFQTFAKEMDTIFNLPSSETKNTEENPFNWEYAIAKHFFELGLKAQKGEKV